jgi:phospholipase C
MDRREFLRAVAAGGLAAAGLPRLAARAANVPYGNKVTDTATNTQHYVESILNQPAANSPVDTIVILMMENRSFDHYLGWLATDAAYVETGRSRYGSGFTVDGRIDLSYTDPITGEPVATYHLTEREGQQDPWRGCGHPDPGHGPVQGRAQRDGGFLAPHSDNDVFALGYFTGEDLPTYEPLLRNFTIFDQYHAAILSSTYPNRLYLQSAQCGDDMDPPLPIQQAGFDWPCIWDRLLAAGVSCANYFVDLPSALFFGPRVLPMLRPFADFFVDAAAGTLPHVVLLDPSFISGFRTDDHPIGDMRVAQRFVANVVRALTQSPQWMRTALFVTYDEWGGFFDHVAPPVVADDRQSAVDLQNFGQVGFRVPTFMVSPYAMANFVDHRRYDHSSILRFLEWRFLGAPAEGPSGDGWWLTARDRNANNIGVSLQSTPVSTEFAMGPLPEIPLASTPCQGFWMQDVPGVDNYDRAGTFAPIEEPISGMELMIPSGYTERIGFTVSTPSISPRELIGQ